MFETVSFPIVLTEFGESAMPYAPGGNPITEPGEYENEEDIRLHHSFCGGYLRVKRTSETHNVLHCSHCGLRVPFPRDITTHSGLKAYFHPEDDSGQ